MIIFEMDDYDKRRRKFGILQGKRVAFVGKLASMSRRDAGQLVRRHGATVLERPDASAHLVVVGEEELPLAEGEGPEQWFDESARQAAENGDLEIITETQLWHRLGLVEHEQDIHRLYTPAMLAELLGVPVAVIRRWHRRGLIVPVREVRRAAVFRFSGSRCGAAPGRTFGGRRLARRNRKKAQCLGAIICPA